MTALSAVVTGASRGIGLAIAQALAADGYCLTLSARRPEGLEQAAGELRERTEVQAVAANLASEDDVRRLADEHARRFDGLDLLVLNAGVGFNDPIAEQPLKQYDLMFNVNLRAQFILIQHALPLLRKSAAANPERGAKVVALASITGVAAEPKLGVYGATKAALISLCETLNLEESGHGVTATALSPGYVDTDMAAWKRDEISTMLKAQDVATLVQAVSRLSANAVVPNIVLARAGDQLWRA
ncbi:SDR family oxidoreductase [Amycolatopsis sp. K13G38]|uniref:SDR family oxidoreductase n=1 Tax=Amycolatopsis acididurans TaxID=2724524 RepID=A0ABX1J2W9_9PSEU|nr:SDR family oxidoreductase [Amycolatopsis acididurans]NKQ52705.1 SDR family oxidoreductase [Amycolatopsis acididurans]